MLGMVFAAVYLALPAISGAFLPEPISIFPLPFKDLTSNTETFLPAVPVHAQLRPGPGARGHGAAVLGDGGQRSSG